MQRVYELVPVSVTMLLTLHVELLVLICANLSTADLLRLRACCSTASSTLTKNLLVTLKSKPLVSKVQALVSRFRAFRELELLLSSRSFGFPERVWTAYGSDLIEVLRPCAFTSPLPTAMLVEILESKSGHVPANWEFEVTLSLLDMLEVGASGKLVAGFLVDGSLIGLCCRRCMVKHIGSLHVCCSWLCGS